MKLDEALDTLKSAGFMVESVEIDGIDLFERRIKDTEEVRDNFIDFANKLNVLLNGYKPKFDVMYDASLIVLHCYLNTGSKITVKQNWNVELEGWNYYEKLKVWSKEKAYKSIEERLDNLKEK